MKIGIPREIKIFENRVGLIPEYVKRLKDGGHTVYVQSGAGMGSGYEDRLYRDSGAIVVSRMEEVYEESDLIVKVKEPQSEEFKLIKEGQIIFSFFHFPSDLDLVKNVQRRKCIAVAFETLVDMRGRTPILSPMSAVAGKLGVQLGMQYLEKTYGGKGLLLGGLPGVDSGNVVVIGGGVVGRNACEVAGGLGANVILFDINIGILNELATYMPKNVRMLYPEEGSFKDALLRADIVVGAVHAVGKKTPVLIRKEMLSLMERGSVIVDVAIDQGGCSEASRATDHKDPVFEVEGVIHYCVANMPSIVSRTSTQLLSHALFPYLEMMSDIGIRKAILESDSIRSGINLFNGEVVHRDIADSLGLEWSSLDDLIG